MKMSKKKPKKPWAPLHSKTEKKKDKDKSTVS